MRLGADPEVFLQEKTSDSFLSVIGMVGANKWAPKQIEGLPEGFTLQEDNVALEFGIPPAATADEFVHHIQTVLKAGLSNLPATRFSKLSCVIFPEKEMEHPCAHIFGCEPDFDAWTGKENIKPQPPHPFMRSAGGHVHVETKHDPKNVVRAMDLFLGVPSVLMDSGTERRKLYGKAGAFRPKPYGVEYRTLSNFWIFDEKLIRWVWDNTELAHINAHADIINQCGSEIQSCINNGDTKLAEQLVKEFHLNVC